jgi:hypothetical protein
MSGTDDASVERSRVEQIEAEAIKRARAKNARLRLLKERNEMYLAEQRQRDDYPPEEVTDEL